MRNVYYSITDTMVRTAVGATSCEAYSKQVGLLEMVLEWSSLAEDVVLGKSVHAPIKLRSKNSKVALKFWQK